jgi:diaminopimelate decarboxylase
MTAMAVLSLGDRTQMTARIRDYLKKRRDSGTDEGPVLVVDLDVVKTNYQNFAKALPDTRVFYAVKANPAPEVLALLVKLGSCFDTASVPEVEMVIGAGCAPAARAAQTKDRSTSSISTSCGPTTRLLPRPCRTPGCSTP